MSTDDVTTVDTSGGDGLAELHPGQIGRYRILGAIGEGGFGVVYEAEQTEPVRRRVALKVIKLGMDTKQVIARFEAERQALALMDHPNIAKVLDAGATETGRPYFVMEIVRGEPITDYCDKNELTVEERLRLFQSVCNAVQHAHQKGIIHRDIKPSNVLITLHDNKPTPKVIDFGIAKATSSRLTEKTVFTQQQQLIGTPEYMSPEQAEMSGIDIDTRSDVYSLGVLLYELLTSVTPFDAEKLRSAGYGEIQRIIREQAPPKPSTRLSALETVVTIATARHTEPKKLGLLLRGDLDWIVMKAMEKSRARRYDTAIGLAADIERFLTNQPVTATPPSAAYRMHKFIRRNRAGVTAAVIVGAVLILGIIGTSLGLARAISEKNRADAETERAVAALAEADAAAVFLESALLSVTPTEAAGRDTELMELVLANAADTIETDLADQDQIRAEMLATLGSAYSQIAQYDRAIELFERALATFDALGNAIDPARLNAVLDLAYVYRNAERIDEVIVLVDETLDALDRADVEGPVLVKLLAERGQAEISRHDAEAALEYADRALLAMPDEADATLSISARMLRGQALRRLNRLPEAEEEYVRVTEIIESSAEPDILLLASAFNALAILNRDQGDAEESVAMYRRAVAVRRALDPRPDQQTSIITMNLARGLLRLGEFEEARTVAEESVAMQLEIHGENHIGTGIARATLAGAMAGQGDIDAAIEEFDTSVAAFAASVGLENPFTLRSMMDKARVLFNASRYAEAESTLLGILEIVGNAQEDQSGSTVTAKELLSRVCWEMQRRDEALLWLSDVIEMLEEDHPNRESLLARRQAWQAGQ